ncbi:putative N-glycosidase R617 [Blattamonas nauphoetae]|uniref:N-glycosidase R617 n=1 Tax=Blattamonas nauphoetae TaxID=2049346 RepID=A0ABQ9XL79_9EUKA|nr:putative N-glycosidase R617 [Blattamonas nauphoetae]
MESLDTKQSKQKVIVFFGPSDPYPQFNQWATAKFEEDGLKFSCAEQYMMYRKAKLFNDQEIADKILRCTNPNVAMALGRQVKRFQNDIWEQHRFDIVVRGNYLKYSQNPHFRDVLLKTGDSIIAEGCDYDKIWGTGFATGDVRNQDPNLWPGMNLLGKALMEVRSLILKEQAERLGTESIKE